MQASTFADDFSLLLAVLLVLPLTTALCLRLPAVFALGFVAILCLFSSSTWGQLQEENTLYARGTGLFHYSLLNLLLWAATTTMVLRYLNQARPSLTASPFPTFIAAFSFMMLGHLFLGLMAGQEALVIFGYNGILNVFNMACFSLLLLMALQSPADRRRLLLLMLLLAGLRAVFGLARYVFWGGDSANPYRNFESLDIKLVYFDIADNYIAALAAFCIAWLLLMPGVRMSLFRRIALLGLLAVEVATVALSFRRSSLIGLGLMFLVLMWRLPMQRRLLYGGFGLFSMVTAAATLMRQRLQFNTGSTGFLSSLLYDVGPDRATEVSRFYELEAAAHSLSGNWLFGLGSWGSFYGNEEILDYHFGKFDFVHSGFGHLILKSGIAGLSLFLALLAAFMIHYLKSRSRWRGNDALMADAGLAGLLFWLPTLLIGTPIIEFRSMLLLGLTLALPYMTQSVSRSPLFVRSVLHATA